MKKIFVPFCLMLITVTALGQYKKASFFTKDGRVYELGVGNSMFADRSGSAPLSIIYSSSVETEKKLSGFAEIEFMLKSQLKYVADYYDANANTNTTGNVYVNRGSALLARYGLQFRFVNTEKESSKLEPYIRLAFFYGVTFGSGAPKDKNGQDVSPTPYPSDGNSLLGLDGGAGISYYFTNNFGVRLGGFYRMATNGNIISGNNDGAYNPFKAHPGISLTLKYKIFSE